MSSLVTTCLEILAALSLAAAAGVEVARYSIAGGLAAVGVVLVLESAAIDRRNKPAAPSADEVTAA